MNLPSIPTDNLYKFLALAGLLIALFAHIYPRWQADQLHLKIIEMQVDGEILETEMRWFTIAVDAPSKKPKPTVADMQSIRAAHTENGLRLVRFKSKQEQLKVLMAQLKYFQNMFSLGAGIGTSMAMSGFIHW